MNQLIELNPLNPSDHFHLADLLKKRVVLPNIIPKRYPVSKIVRRGSAILRIRIFLQLILQN